MQPLYPSVHVSVSIARTPAEVYAYCADPRNLPAWASGLAAGSVTQVGDAWQADSPMGKIRIAFAPRNTFGVLDHDVTLPDGVTVHNPLRVLPNADGSEVVFTLFRRPEMNDAQFAHDAAWIEQDLARLKQRLEQG